METAVPTTYDLTRITANGDRVQEATGSTVAANSSK